MTLTLLNWIARGLAVVFCSAAIVIGTTGILAKSDTNIPAAKPASSSESISSAHFDFAKLEQLAPFVDTSLRAPLYDPPPAPPPEKPAPPPLKVAFKLVGTVAEGNQRRAILSGPNGDIEIRGVGETLTIQVGGLVLEQVAETQVLVRSPSHPEPSIITLDSGETN